MFANRSPAVDEPLTLGPQVAGMARDTLGTFTIGLGVGAFAVLLAIIELVRRDAERRVVSVRLSRHPRSRAVSWGEVWDHTADNPAHERIAIGA